MYIHRTLNRKVNSARNSFEAKVQIKYLWDSYQRLEECFECTPEEITEMYKKIEKGEAMFLTIIVESKFGDMCGSDCLGSVWIDTKYTIDDCVEENQMIENAVQDLLGQMEKTYSALKRVLA